MDLNALLDEWLNAEYRRYPELDTLCLSMPGDAGPNAHAEG